jgi:hypothetical protein
MKRTPLLRKTPLKSRTPLKSYKPLNKVSKKQAKENALWAKIKRERIKLLLNKYGILYCENCLRVLSASNMIEGHHNNHNRRDNSLLNCRIVCHECNYYTIEDNNIKDVPSLL